MAVCTYIRKGSPFLWLQFGPPNNRSQESSKVRIDDPDADYKLAKKINKIEARQLLRSSGSGWDWVPGFLSARYQNSAGSLRIHTNAWNWLAAWLREQGIKGPDELTSRAQVMEYLDWRMSRRKQKSGRFPIRNTALYDMRVLGRVMSEAVLREMTERNPAANLGLKRDSPEPKPEIFADQQELILDALRKKPLWMSRPFQTALQTGLRHHETRIDLRRNVEWEQAHITIPAPKGGTKRAFTFPVMQMSLMPYLRAIEDRYTWQLPARLPKPIGMIWREFFDDLGLHEITFHCTRVTFISWCFRAVPGVRPPLPENVVMKLVNHASVEIHRIYQRLNVVDVQAWRDPAGWNPASAVPPSRLPAPQSPARAAASVSRPDILAR